MKKSWFGSGFLLLSLSLVLLLSGCSSKGDAVASEGTTGDKPATLKIKIADINTNATFRVAVDKGIFAKHGIDAELINFGTPAEGVNALFIKQVDVAYGADFPVLNAVAKGDYSIIASAGLATDAAAATWKLFVRDAIQQPEDLKGKNLSFMRGTFLPYLWDEYLKENHIALGDVILTGQGAFDEAYIALKQGDVDAAWFSGSALSDKLNALEGVHELTDMSKTTVRLGMGIVTSNDFAKQNPEGIANFLAAVDEAATYAQANPDEAADIMFKEVKQPKESTLKDLPTNPWKVGFTQAAYDSLANQKKYMVDTGIIENDFDLGSKLSLEPLKQALPEAVTYEK
ncbi:ABC transporter substrate-binding protein [Paenibacillus monticola]|uniref:PhnD/SsuA/transferrin family substrate-binding protein n=1 Tax=Paenibacillus monticola TaxID=2666075 RepID=A0A7X2L3G9_9BACL|nr:ABC transporter substrate-binding protein [Paenibacillus monticola]MRN55268.1 PhnD/SsuA/transferrin family substrate-binding protein [Paenibacillus monticola]